MAEFNPKLWEPLDADPASVAVGAPARFENISPQDRQRVLDTFGVKPIESSSQGPAFDPSQFEQLPAKTADIPPLKSSRERYLEAMKDPAFRSKSAEERGRIMFPESVKASAPTITPKPGRGFFGSMQDDAARGYETFSEGWREAINPQSYARTLTGVPLFKMAAGGIQSIFAPITGPINELIARPAGNLARKLPVPDPETLGQQVEIATDIAAPMAAGPLSNFVKSKIASTGPASRSIAKYLEKERLNRLIGDAKNERSVKAGELSSKADDLRAQQSILAPKMDKAVDELRAATAIDNIATNDLDAVQGTLMPMKPPVVDSMTLGALDKLKKFPLRTELDETGEVLKKAGEAYLGPTAKLGEAPTNSGLFRTASKAIKQRFTDRINNIIPENAVVGDLSPIKDAAQKILPQGRIANVGTPAQRLASGIDEILERPLDPFSKGELAADELARIQRQIGFQHQISLDDVVNPAKLTIMAEDSMTPSLRNIHGERVIIRAMKRAADKGGHSVLKSQLETLEHGYTKALNNSLGPQGAKALKLFDNDYGIAVRELFGYDSPPYKLATLKSAEDFATSLFRKTGQNQGRRAERVVELLGPEYAHTLGEPFLQVVAVRSQSKGLPLHPEKWGKEYLAYNDTIKNAIFDPRHKADLDAIAKTFVQQKGRTLAAELAYQEQLGKRAPAIDLALQRAGKTSAAKAAAKARESEVGELLKQVNDELRDTITAIKANKKPGDAEQSMLEALAERHNEGFLGKAANFALNHMVYGGFAMLSGSGWGNRAIMSGGTMWVSARGLQKLLSHPHGAHLVHLQMTAKPGSAEALKIGTAASALLNHLNAKDNEAPMQTPKDSLIEKYGLR